MPRHLELIESCAKPLFPLSLATYSINKNPLFLFISVV